MYSTLLPRTIKLPKFVDVGEPVTGFPVEMKTTSRSLYAMADGTKKENTSAYETRVVQLEEGPLDASMFEIPGGFRQVAHIETNPAMDWQTVLADNWQWLKAKVRQIFVAGSEFSTRNLSQKVFERRIITPAVPRP